MCPIIMWAMEKIKTRNGIGFVLRGKETMLRPGVLHSSWRFIGLTDMQQHNLYMLYLIMLSWSLLPLSQSQSESIYPIPISRVVCTVSHLAPCLSSKLTVLPGTHTEDSLMINKKPNDCTYSTNVYWMMAYTRYFRGQQVVTSVSFHRRCGLHIHWISRSLA